MALRPMTDADWEMEKETIWSWYVNGPATRSAVVEYMRQKGFDARLSQLAGKLKDWNFKKPYRKNEGGSLTEPQRNTQGNWPLPAVHIEANEVPGEAGNPSLDQGGWPLEQEPQIDVGWHDALGDTNFSQNSQGVNERWDDLSELFPQYAPDNVEPLNDLLPSGPSDGVAEGFSQYPPNSAGPLDYLLYSGPSDNLHHQDSSQHSVDDDGPFDDLLHNGSFDVDEFLRDPSLWLDSIEDQVD